MKKPKISIITVCFNSEKHLEECIQSVIKQPYENKEYIIIDGGSTDGTIDIVEKYRDKIDYFISEPDEGISDAFNKGIKVATGDLVGIINSDDKLVDDALTDVAKYYDGQIDMYRGVCVIWNDKTNYQFDEIPTIYWPLIPIKMRGAHPATFVSREAYAKYGVYDKSLKMAMDTDLFVRFSQRNANVKFIDTHLAYFRLGGTSQTDEKRRLKELKRILKKNGATWLQVTIFSFYYRLRLLFKHFVSLFGEDFRFKFTKWF